MFDLLIGSAQAYQQVGLFFGALVCFGLGALLVGNSTYWHLRGLRATGTIIGVVNEGGTYAPVYRYTAADGSLHEAKSTMGSATLAGNETGRVVPLLVSPHDPARAQQADIGWVETVFVVAGLVLVMAGIWMGTTAVTAYPVTVKTWIMAGLMMLYGVWHLRRGIVPRGQSSSLPEAWRFLAPGDAAVGRIGGVVPIEKIIAQADPAQTSGKTLQQSTKSALFVLVFAVLLAGVAVYQADTVSRLESAGSRAEGRVIGLKSESSSRGSYSYYPIVRYRAQSNLTFEFKDSVGSNPPSYRVGDQVTVLYLPDDPRTRPMIDRGLFWNWVIPVVLGVGALLLFWLYLFLRRTDSQAGGVNQVAPGPMRFTV